VSELGKVEKYIMYSLGESDFFFIIRENERANQVKDAYFFKVGVHGAFSYKTDF